MTNSNKKALDGYAIHILAQPRAFVKEISTVS